MATSRRTEAPARTKTASFDVALREAVVRAAAALREEVGGERIYAFVLHTSGQSAFSYVCVSANTEEALRRSVAADGSRPSERGAKERDLRWSVCDWEWHDVSPEVGAMALPPGESDTRDRRVKKAFYEALRAADASGVLGVPRPVLAVACGDMTPAFFFESIDRLNPPEVAEALRAELTPERWLEGLEALAPATRLSTCLDLYRDLVLRRRSPTTLEAARCSVTEHALEAPLLRLGAPARRGLLALAESFVEGPTFHAKGSAEWKAHGAFTRTQVLATSAIHLASRMGLDAADVASLQRLIARRLEIDRDVAGPVSLIPAIAARALHAHDPTRFPEPLRSPSNNRLGNAEAFLSRG